MYKYVRGNAATLVRIVKDLRPLVFLIKEVKPGQQAVNRDGGDFFIANPYAAHDTQIYHLFVIYIEESSTAAYLALDRFGVAVIASPYQLDWLMEHVKGDE